MRHRKPAPKRPRETIVDFIASTLVDADKAIVLVDRDLATGRLVVLVETGTRLQITIAPLD